MTRSPSRVRHARRSPPATLAAAAAVVLAACHGNPAPPEPPPPPEALVVSAGSLITTEGGTGASFDAALASTPAATVEVEVRSGDPTEGLVFVGGYAGPAAARELTFTPHDWNVPRRVVVQPVDDRALDASVTYPVSLRVAYSDDMAYAAVPHVEVRVTNLDDEAPGIIVEPQGALPLRTDEAGEAAAFTIWLACAPAGVVQIPVTVGDTTEGLVLGGSSPFVPQPSVTVTFTPADWETPRTITVIGQPDHLPDGDQTYGITVGPPSGDAGYAALGAQTVAVVNAQSEWTVSTDVPREIPEVGEATSTLTLAGAPSAVAKVRVRVNITHTFDGDLALYLVSSSGTTVALANHVGGGGANFTSTVFDDSAATPIAGGSAPFTGTYAPSEPLSALAGQDANGIWRLRVVDGAAGDRGTIDGWALRIE